MTVSVDWFGADTYTGKAVAYALAITSGDRAGCKWTRLACERFLQELEDGVEGYYFDQAAAEHFCTFFETLPHIKGEWASRNELIHLEGWQCFVFVPLFGWKREADHGRRFAKAYIEVPKKCSKTTMGAGFALYMTTEDGEAGAEVYCVASKMDQARICFDTARAMVMKQAMIGDLSSPLTVYKKSLPVLDPKHPSANSVMKPLHSEGTTMDGINPHAVVADELHAWSPQKRKVFDNISDSMGARRQPLLFMITTAGTEFGICYQQRGYLTQILEGALEDPSVFGCIWSIDKDDDPFAPESWEKANPNFGVSVYPFDMERIAREAEALPGEKTKFLTKRLNVWTGAGEAFGNMKKWEACARPAMKLSDFAGYPCIVGGDFASKIDIAALSLLFWDGSDNPLKRHYYNFVFPYLPEGALADGDNKGIYDGWHRAGHLITTPGARLDMDIMEARISKYRRDKLLEEHKDLELPVSFEEQFQILEVAFDPAHNAGQFGQHMDEDGLNPVEVRATVLNYSEAMKCWAAWVANGQWQHDGNPCMTWMYSNVEVRVDAKDNIFPRHIGNDQARKIDGPVATISAIHRALAAEEATHTGELLVLGGS